MADFSTRLISEIRSGDLILSYNERKMAFVPGVVSSVMSRQVDRVVCIETTKKTFVTGEHPFLVRGNGWVRAEHLAVGDCILHLSLSEKEKECERVRLSLSEYAKNGAVVRGIRWVSAEESPKAWVRLAGTLSSKLTVYNLEVEDTHTYIANSLIAHNCDTDYTSHRERLPTKVILDRVNLLPRRKLVVITGGEPFRQDCTDLVWRLVNTGRKVQFETNGTLFLGFPDMNMFLPGEVTIVCSPKTPKLCNEIVPFIDAFKYVVADGEVDTDGLPLKSVGPQYGRPARPPEGYTGEIYVQPLDVQDEKENVWHLAAAVKSCMDHGYRLCLQTHKIAGLP